MGGVPVLQSRSGRRRPFPSASGPFTCRPRAQSAQGGLVLGVEVLFVFGRKSLGALATLPRTPAQRLQLLRREVAHRAALPPELLLRRLAVPRVLGVPLGVPCDKKRSRRRRGGRAGAGPGSGSRNVHRLQRGTRPTPAPPRRPPVTRRGGAAARGTRSAPASRRWRWLGARAWPRRGNLTRAAQPVRVAPGRGWSALLRRATGGGAACRGGGRTR